MQALLAPPPPDATCLVLHNRYDFSSTSHDDHTVQSNYVMPLNTLANFRQCANVRCIYQKKKNEVDLYFYHRQRQWM